jgi:hypothetical protein
MAGLGPAMTVGHESDPKVIRSAPSPKDALAGSVVQIAKKSPD